MCTQRIVGELQCQANFVWFNAPDFILEVFGYILSYRQAFVMFSMAFLYQYEWIMPEI